MSPYQPISGFEGPYFDNNQNIWVYINPQDNRPIPAEMLIQMLKQQQHQMNNNQMIGMGGHVNSNFSTNGVFTSNPTPMQSNTGMMPNISNVDRFADKVKTTPIPQATTAPVDKPVDVNQPIPEQMLKVDVVTLAAGGKPLTDIAFSNEYRVLPLINNQRQGAYYAVPIGEIKNMDKANHFISRSRTININQIVREKSDVNSSFDYQPAYVGESEGEVVCISNAMDQAIAIALGHHHGNTPSISSHALQRTMAACDGKDKDYEALCTAATTLLDARDYEDWLEKYRRFYHDNRHEFPNLMQLIDRRLSKIVSVLFYQAFSFELIIKKGLARECEDIVTTLEEDTDCLPLVPIFNKHFMSVIREFSNFTPMSIDGVTAIATVDEFDIMVIDDSINLPAMNSAIEAKARPGIITSELLPELYTACQYLSHETVKSKAYYVIVSTNGSWAIVERCPSPIRGTYRYLLRHTVI